MHRVKTSSHYPQLMINQLWSLDQLSRLAMYVYALIRHLMLVVFNKNWHSFSSELSIVINRFLEITFVMKRGVSAERCQTLRCGVGAVCLAAARQGAACSLVTPWHYFSLTTNHRFAPFSILPSATSRVLFILPIITRTTKTD